MAEAEKIPKIDPAEVEILIERVKQNKLEEREAELIAGLLRSLLSLKNVINFSALFTMSCR